MTQQSQIHATIGGRLYTFTLTASSDTPIPADVAHGATTALRVGLSARLNAEVQVVQGPVEVGDRSEDAILIARLKRENGDLHRELNRLALERGGD